MGMEEEEKEKKNEDEAKEDEEEDKDKVVEHSGEHLQPTLLRAEWCRTHHPPKPSPGSAFACSPTPFLADVILKP